MVQCRIPMPAELLSRAGRCPNCEAQWRQRRNKELVQIYRLGTRKSRAEIARLKRLLRGLPGAKRRLLESWVRAGLGRPRPRVA